MVFSKEEYGKKYYKEHKEEIKKRAKEWAKENPEKYRKLMRAGRLNVMIVKRKKLLQDIMKIINFH